MKYILLTFALFTQPVFAEIYKWIDDSGKVHFGDSPPHEKQVEEVVVEVNSYEHVTSEHVEFYKGYSSNKVIMYSTSWCKYLRKHDDTSKQTVSAMSNMILKKIRLQNKRLTSLVVRGFR